MSQKRIIERYGLQARALTLAASGKKDYEIAEILTREDLAGKDAISQPSVSRWLKKTRQERGKTAKGIVDDYLKESIPADLKLLDELTQFHLVIFRGNVTMLEGEDGKKVHAATITLDTRRTAARDIHEILKTKMKFVGVDGESGGNDRDGAAPVDLEKYRGQKPEVGDQKSEGGGLRPDGI